MQSESSEESNDEVEIQKTLVSINKLASKIKNELNAINELVNENGRLHTTIINANKTLTVVAEDMGIDVENVLNNEEKETELKFNLRNILPSTAFEQKIAACLQNN